jgi:Holliday junction resolvase RusA-like endonuclease
MSIVLTITGHPLILKNNKQIVVINGHRIVKSNPRVEAYQHRATAELCEQWGTRPPITEPVNLAITSYGAWKRSSDTIPDASNLYQLPEDLLQSAGILADDRQVESHDGSRRVCMCDTCPQRRVVQRGPKRGQLTPDCGAVKKCPFERVVIEITAATAAEGEK